MDLICISFPLEVEFEFITWAWVEVTAEWTFWWWLTKFSCLLTYVNECKWMAGNLATTKWPFHSWPSVPGYCWLLFQWWPELKLSWWTQTLPQLYRIHAQVVNSNSTSALQDPCSGGELKLYLDCTGSKLRWWTQTLPWLYRIHAQVVNSNSTSALQDPSSRGELKLYLGFTGSMLRWWTQTLPRLYRIQAQVVNSNSTSAVQDPRSGSDIKLYLGCTGSKLRWWTQTLP